MSLLLNISIIVVTIAVLIGIVYFFVTKDPETETAEVRFSYSSLKSDVKDMVNNYIGVSISGLGLTKQAARNQEEQRRNVARCVRSCCGGNAGAREVVQDIIRNHLTRDKGINEENILHAIPFNRPKDMTARQLALALILHFDGGEDKGFKVLMDEYQLCAPKYDGNGSIYYDITEEDIRQTFNLCNIRLSFREQLNVLVQMIYEDLFGLGAIDVLNQQKGSIEEIQIGMTGIQQKVYDYKQGLIGMDSNRGQVCYSKDAIHILTHGDVVRLSYLTFGTEDEKQRVIRNLIKGSEAGELTVKNPHIVVDTVDGRRVSVARPPMADAWIGLIRKFDSITITSLDEMYRDLNGGDVATGTVKHLVRAGFPIAYTGEMASGKTTMFRAALKETRPDLCIRVIEAGSFELDTRQFLSGRNTMSMRVTDWTPEDEVLSFARKTTGNCFCIGEVNSLKMAVLTMAVSKISLQTMLSAHYTSPVEMVADFTNANLCIGGYTSEKLAEMDAVRALGFDVHVKKMNGRRYISSINEIVPEFDLESGYSSSVIDDSNAQVRMAEAVREVRKQLGQVQTYSIRKILEYDEENQRYVCYNQPSEFRMRHAKEYMPKVQYEEMIEFFSAHYSEDGSAKSTDAVDVVKTADRVGLLSAGGTDEVTYEKDASEKEFLFEMETEGGVV